MRYTIADLIAAAEAIDAVEKLKAELAEFCAQYLDAGDDAGVIDFLDIGTGDAFNVPAVEAQAYFRGKGLRPAFSYADMLGIANDQAFTVAKMMDVDLLKQVRDSLDGALANGTSFGQWRKEIGSTLKAAGWWGTAPMPDPLTGQMVNAQLGSAWRLETIFRTNMQTAYAAGNWRQIEAQADVAPWLMYDAIDDFRTRPEHRAWDGTVLPAKSPWWKTHYPPNGWNCRCGVIQLSDDQLERLGISPRPEPPDDGDYQWQNPRTGERIAVPKGIDPGFDRNPGNMLIAELRTLLKEKVEALPPTMQAAVAPTLRREFDATTAAGKWHAVSFEESPDWLRDRVVDLQAVDVKATPGRGAVAYGGRLIDMGSKTTDAAKDQNTWRHEFGHIMDYRLASKALYRSSHLDFVSAQKIDGEALTVAAGGGRKSKANAARQQAIVTAYEDVRTRFIDADRAARPDLLRQLAADADIDFGQFLGLVRESTLILQGADDLQDVGIAVRLARMIEAIRLADGEGFLRWASFKDSVDAMHRGVWDAELQKTHSKSWKKDGSLSSLSDLIGSATKNKAASYNNGFPGHKNSYYAQSAVNPPTESFANLTALAGHRNPYWIEIASRFAPNMTALYRDIIEGKA